MRVKRPTTFTTTPDTPPPDLRCPLCARRLIYRQTIIGGVEPVERWDRFECMVCGSFEYRCRTRTLQPSPGDALDRSMHAWRIQYRKVGYRVRT